MQETVTRTIDGNEVTRKGEEGNKALLIHQDDGQRVLKLENEVKKIYLDSRFRNRAG